ncbi:MAG: hypothetical protein ACOZCO_14200 [Bacteroidota bacterium]
MNKNSVLALVLGSSLFIASCKKEEADTDTQSAVDYAYLKLGYNTVLPVTNNITVNEEGLDKTNLYTCATVTRIAGDTTNWPASGDTLVYEVNYGTSGCVDTDGRMKSGILTVSFYSNFQLSGGQVRVVPTNFYVDGLKFEGDMTLQNNGNYNYSKVVTGGKCVASTWTISYDGTTTMTWTAGFNTPTDPTDDSYSFTEAANAVNRKGSAFTVSTTSAVIKNCNCKWISQGTVEITPSGLATRTIDFGNGTCDQQATLTINGKVFNFEMQ